MGSDASFESRPMRKNGKVGIRCNASRQKVLLWVTLVLTLCRCLLKWVCSVLWKLKWVIRKVSAVLTESVKDISIAFRISLNNVLVVSATIVVFGTEIVAIIMQTVKNSVVDWIGRVVIVAESVSVLVRSVLSASYRRMLAS